MSDRGGRAVSISRVVGAVQWLVGVAAATCVVMLFALGGGDGGAASPDGGDRTAADRTAADPAVLEQGAQIYASQCAICHGQQGQGGTGPRLAGTVVAVYPDVADQVELVTRGRNSMQGFAGRLDDEEIVAVVAYTREGL